MPLARVDDDGALVPAALLQDWRERLAAHRERARREPQFNPVHHLAFEISGELERGATSLRDLQAAAKALCDEALLARAGRLRNYLGIEPGRAEDGEAAAEERLRALVRASTLDTEGTTVDFETFAARWRRPEDGVVFTAHPTFAMSQALRSVLTDLVEGAKPQAEIERTLHSLPHRPDSPVTLDSEHEQALGALANAQDALALLLRLLIETAAELYPERWRELVPAPVSLATWVGYDLDGRNDITWVDSIRFRLQEKQWQLERYGRRLEALGRPETAAAARLIAEETEAAAVQITAFEHDLENPKALTTAANTLTRQRRGPLGATSQPLLDALDEALGALEAAGARAEAVQLSVLRAEVALHGLGAGLIHLRINAAQVHNAIRKPLGLDPASELHSRVLLNRLDERIETLRPQSVNFASLAMEGATAIRQFIAIAQILKHIDGDKPIRLLIAECEHPFTPLAALYFAQLFGVADGTDISPLFETEHALEHGAAIVESLLKTRSYRRYVGRRGRLSVQTGFSDAGRFIGQVTASLAVERLQGQLAGVVESARQAGELGPTEVLIFDTHGESMGRGAHPESFQARADYVLSPWVRRRYRERGLPLLHETSFQGGDGYVFFGTRRLALATLTSLLEARSAPHTGETPGEGDDPFYAAYLFNRDLHERLRTFQTTLFADADHGTMLTAFSTNLLVGTGSRTSSRQFDGRSDNRLAAASLRAIPHNALLQQMGYTVNICSGLGTALRHDREAFASLHAASARLQTIVELVRQARDLSSLDTMAAYTNLFDGAYWVVRPLGQGEQGQKDPCLLLAEHLRQDPRYYAMLRLVSFLREDAIHLDDLLSEIGADTRHGTGHGPGYPIEGLDPALLHALRIALIQHIFLLAARLPKFSTRNDISQDDVMDLVTRLRVREATKLLRSIFPRTQPVAADYRLEEDATYEGAETVDYAEMNRRLIDPMLSAFEISQEITVGISHAFGAFG
jgi:phosphoenolpyruvate carboxylase